MSLPRVLLALLLQACWATAQDDVAASRAIAFQGEWTCRVWDSGLGCRARPAWTRRISCDGPVGPQPLPLLPERSDAARLATDPDRRRLSLSRGSARKLPERLSPAGAAPSLPLSSF